MILRPARDHRQARESAKFELGVVHKFERWALLAPKCSTHATFSEHSMILRPTRDHRQARESPKLELGRVQQIGR